MPPCMMATPKRLYLVVYNVICFCLWSYVGFLLLFSAEGGVFSTNGLHTEKLWATLQPWVSAAQTLAIMECIHSITGIVRSPFFTTLMQVSSRLHLIWIIWRFCPPSRTGIPLAAAVGAWTAVECIRYPFYAVNSIAAVPYLLKWLRYSAFIVLYPIGIFSEVKCIWISLRYLRQDQMLRSYPFPMPNLLNFELDLYIVYVFLLFAYIPGAIHLYTYMVSQRSKVLAAKPEEKQS